METYHEFPKMVKEEHGPFCTEYNGYYEKLGDRLDDENRN